MPTRILLRLKKLLIEAI